MSKRSQLPVAPMAQRPANMTCELTPLALDRWNPAIKAASSDEHTINIYEPIGYDYWTDEGVTAKRISAILRNLKGADVTVNINSPGGDVWEGLTIYNLLREYEGTVTVRILGVAASAASFIAMAADEIQIARAGFFMIHNAWTGLYGNRNDLRETADFLEQIDGTIADIYAIRTGNDIESLKTQMDAETWINGVNAVDTGFADGFLPNDAVADDKTQDSQQMAVRRLDQIMAKAGISRTERRSLMKDLKQGTHDATQNSMPGATESALYELKQLAGSLVTAATT